MDIFNIYIYQINTFRICNFTYYRWEGNSIQFINVTAILVSGEGDHNLESATKACSNPYGD